jgi:hypothetical protein
VNFQLDVPALSKQDKGRIKILLQHFIEEKSAELDEQESEQPHSPSSNGSDSDHDEKEDDDVSRKKTKKRKLFVFLFLYSCWNNHDKSRAKIPKKKGKKTAAGQPKRPIAAFMYFSQAQRPRVRDENPDFGFGEQAKLLGTMWKGLDDEEKQVHFLFFVFRIFN